MDALFERLDWIYAGLVLLVVLIPHTRFRVLGAAGLGFAVLAAASDRVGGSSGDTTFATINEILIVLGGVIVITAAVAGFRQVSQSPAMPVVPQSPTPIPHPLLFAGLGLTAFAPHILLVELGMVLMLVAAVLATLRSRRLRWLPLLLIGGGILVWAMVLITTILGAAGGDMAGIRDGPFSPAAERLLVLVVGGGTFLLAGLPPFHRAPWGLTLAPLVAIVMMRVALQALPGGVLEWQPLAMLLLTGAGIWAALTRRWAALSVAAGLASLWSGVPSAFLAAPLLILSGWLLGITAGMRRERIPGSAERWTGLILLVPALAALPALEAGLGAQVVVSVVFVAGVIVALIREVLRRPESAPAPLY